VSDGGGKTETTRTVTEEALLSAALRAISQRGSGKLTLSAVAAEAGVSRPTLYRWFPSKTHLLAAITEYKKEQFDLGLSAAIEGGRSPEARLDAALRYLVTYLDAMGADPIGAAPDYALQSLAASLEPQADTLVCHLGSSLARVPAVKSGWLTEKEAAEMFLRLVFSHYLMPHPNPEVVLAALRAFAGVRPGSNNPSMER
jgi:AcrR family transcriptional regulator